MYMYHYVSHFDKLKFYCKYTEVCLFLILICLTSGSVK